MDPALETLLAKEAIREVLAAHTRAIDRADGALLKSCYHADAIEEHGGNYAGNAHAYVDEAIPRVMRMGVMQHLLLKKPLAASCLARGASLERFALPCFWLSS